jgi:FkbM family methyltransferase
MESFARTVRSLIARSGAVRAVVKSALVQHAIVTARAARIVRPRARFVAEQATRRTARYTLPTGQEAWLRHRTRDAAILVEIFGGRRIYDPPPAVDGHLDGTLRVIDLGANIGLFGLFAVSRWDVSEVVTYEPDPDNARLIASYTTDPRWTERRAAASDHDGSMRFRAGLYSESRAAREGETAITVPVRDVFTEAPCDLLKVDIEGGEWPILADPRLEEFARVIVMEWHGAECPEADASAAVHRLLRERGYEHCYDVPGDWERNGLLWAWRD